MHVLWSLPRRARALGAASKSRSKNSASSIASEGSASRGASPATWNTSVSGTWRTARSTSLTCGCCETSIQPKTSPYVAVPGGSSMCRLRGARSGRSALRSSSRQAHGRLLHDVERPQVGHDPRRDREVRDPLRQLSYDEDGEGARYLGTKAHDIAHAIRL